MLSGDNGTDFAFAQAIAYESVLIGLFSIYSGDLKPAVGPSKMQWQGDEHSNHTRQLSLGRPSKPKETC